MQELELNNQTLPCFMVNNLTRNTEEQCKFIIDNDCLEDESYIDYVYLVFCDMSQDMRFLAIVTILAFVIVLFLNLSAVADEFLCPNLLTVAKNLRMSDSLAGVTLLAFGNGCPDIFSSLAAASSGRPEIIVGELLGAGIFCTSIVAGLIFIHSDFKLARRPLMRDATFYLLAVYLIWLYCYQGSITFYGSLAFIIIYVIYLFIALMGQAIHSRLRGEYPLAEESKRQIENETENKEQIEKQLSQQEQLEYCIKWRAESLRRGSLVKWSSCCANEKNTLLLTDDKTSIRISYKNPDYKQTACYPCAQRQPREKPACSCYKSNKINASCWSISGNLNQRSQIDDRCNQVIKQQQSSHNFNTNIDKPILIDVEGDKDKTSTLLGEFLEFLKHISPIGMQDWTATNLLGKTILIIRAPLLLLTTLTVPVVSPERKLQNWNRMLNSIQCVTIPAAIMVLLKLGDSITNDNVEDDDLDLVIADYDNLDGRNLNETPTRSFDQIPTVATISSDSFSLTKLVDFITLKVLVIIPAIVLALFVFYSTSAFKAPKYHVIYSYLGFGMSVMWIYMLANEIISILKTVGIIFSMTDTAIGLGVLAWGNSLGDIVANLTLAEAGHARMALGASIGAPLLNLLLGFGLSFTVSLKPGQQIQIKYTHTITLLAMTLAFVLILLMLSTLASGSRSKKPFGYLLISCYGIYFALAVCLECGLINI